MAYTWIIMEDRRIRIISGHLGSGKTEFSVNYAFSLKERFSNVGLADLDVVNPYFRSRERKDLLAKAGIRLVGSVHGSISVDTPSVSAEVNTLIEDNSIQAVLDTGGDPGGVRLLARFASMIPENEYDMLMVVNANRTETRTAGQVLSMLRQLQEVSGLKITGLINNTHLLKSTTIHDIIRGAELTSEVAAAANLSIRYHSMLEGIVKDLPAGFSMDFKGTIFPLKLYMRDEWMS